MNIAYPKIHLHNDYYNIKMLKLLLISLLDVKKQLLAVKYGMIFHIDMYY